MGLLDKLFGKCRNSSSGFQDEIKIVDLRSATERQIERQAQSKLSREEGDEKFARKLCVLLEQLTGPGDAADKEIRKIGELLYSNGGEDRMKLVYYRVRAIGGAARTLERYWDGIGTWMG